MGVTPWRFKSSPRHQFSGFSTAHADRRGAGRHCRNCPSSGDWRNDRRAHQRQQKQPIPHRWSSADPRFSVALGGSDPRTERRGNSSVIAGLPNQRDVLGGAPSPFSFTSRSPPEQSRNGHRSRRTRPPWSRLSVTVRSRDWSKMWESRWRASRIFGKKSIRTSCRSYGRRDYISPGR